VSIREWLWSLLPDTCEIDDCDRKGMRGNENLIKCDAYPEFYITMCDHCSSRYERGEVMPVSGLNDMIMSKYSGITEMKVYKRNHHVDEG
jgi:hypothetical protein